MVHGKYGGVDRAYSRKRRTGRSKIALVQHTDTCTWMRRVRLGDLWACSSRKNFWKFDALRWLLRPILGLKTSIGSLRFSLGMVTEFTSHAGRLVSIGIGSFRYTLGTGRRSGTQKPVNILLLWIYFEQRPSRMCDHCTHNLLVLRSPMFSFVLGPRSSCGHKSVLVICVLV